jgi:plasmid stabilization system protein ParE
MKLIIETRAERDLSDLVNWLAERSPSAADRALEMFFSRVDRLLDFPTSAPEVEGGKRELFIDFGRDGFVVRYRLHQETILVERVYHGLQDRG